MSMVATISNIFYLNKFNNLYNFFLSTVLIIEACAKRKLLLKKLDVDPRRDDDA